MGDFALDNIANGGGTFLHPMLSAKLT